MIRCGECKCFEPGWKPSSMGICNKCQEWTAPEWYCDKGERIMKCVEGFEIKPMKSAAGWYMGTTEDGMPKCRCTTNYYSTKEEAKKNMFDDYRYCKENNFCSHGRVCFSNESKRWL